MTEQMYVERLRVDCGRTTATVLMVAEPDRDDAVNDRLAHRLAVHGVAIVRLPVGDRCATLGCTETALARAVDTIRGAAQHPGERVACVASGRGVAAALSLAVGRPELFDALVLRRIPLATLGVRTEGLRVLTLFVVGSYEQPDVDFVRSAVDHIGLVAHVAVVPRATRTLDDAESLCTTAAVVFEWLRARLAPARRRLAPVGCGPQHDVGRELFAAAIGRNDDRRDRV